MGLFVTITWPKTKNVYHINHLQPQIAVLCFSLFCLNKQDTVLYLVVNYG